MATTTEQQSVLLTLEDHAEMLLKAESNLKKTPKVRLTKGYIESRIVTINEYWKAFKRSHDELVKLTPKAQKAAITYFAKEEFYVYEDLYNVLQGDLKDLLEGLSTNKSHGSDATYVETNTHSGVVHLPKIQIPTFTSSYEGWPAFKDLFTSLVHENSALSDVQKFHYLKTSVTGEAEVLLKHIQVTASNYKVAWDILSTRYGNKRLIINNIMKRLFNQKKLTTQSAVQIKSLIDTTVECLNNLENLKVSTDSWDLIIIHLLVQKLDSESHKEWEQYVSDHTQEENEELPTWKQFKKFMESKFKTLELVTTNVSQTRQIKERTFHVATPVKQNTCTMCNEDHTLCHCKKFIKMEPKERREYVKNKHLCFNCLAQGHSVARCKISVSCRICRRRHHSLLHETKNTELVDSTTDSQIQPLASHHVVDEMEVQINTMIASHFTTRQNKALLATAIVEAISEQGYITQLRALVDPGSEAAFISEKATQILKLKRQSVKGSASGLACMKTKIRHSVQLQIRSQWDQNFSLPIQAYVISKQLTNKMPAKTILAQQWPHIKGLNLADPNYLKAGPVDLLLGIRQYSAILQQGLIKGPPDTPCAQNTQLGWIIFGDLKENSAEATYRVMHSEVDVDEMLKSIWELEPDNKRLLTKEEKVCENIYEKTTTRNEEGRYIVHLPFNTYSPQAPEGNTKEIATTRFLQLERKFRRAPDLKQEYIKVINDYKEQGHLEEIPKEERKIKCSVYLPHHAVVRNDKETSRTRVVFDASCKGINNISLNDELHVGPQLQDDLRNLLIRWRMKRVCFMADIRQMYRQILVVKEHSDYQRIIWRADETDELNEYRLLRVTFGTASAPYLAVRTIHQVANDEGVNKPLAVQSIKTNFYMDDWLDGADDSKSAVLLATEVTQILQKGGFELTKWSSNNVDFMKFIDQDKRSTKVHVDMNLDGTIKALGIVWNLRNDNFQYNLNLPSTPLDEEVTKRRILSDIQKLFDPLGWIAPSTVLAKILMQRLWLEKLSWDENVSEELREEWLRIRADFTNINKLQIPRWFGTTDRNKAEIELHGFSDASMRAYSAAVYLRTKAETHKIKTSLVAARTRIAPLKTVSLPRLELLGLLLLSRLMKQVGQALNISTSNMYAWTDSSIVVAWMSGEPGRWKPFVANRVVEIAENLNNRRVYHVESAQNPADLASRGVLLADLNTSDLWWNGPCWLSESEIKFSKLEAISTELELKSIKLKTYLNTEVDKSFTEEFEKFDNLTELLKTITYCRRFLYFKRNTSTENYITTRELEDALIICIKKIQTEEFQEEIDRMKDGKQVKGTSPLRFLNPYIDEKGLLRVGGRLKHANLPDDTKHPIILGNKNSLVPLIIAEAHKKTLHGGIQLMMSYLRSRYWIIRVKSMVKKYTRRCFICVKLRATAKTQMMGNLPTQRVTPARPFLNSSVDFAGPFQILMSKGRGNKTVKAYVAIFVDMATTAIHIELVGDLTSESFIGAFRRFVARRGKCSHLWSDQGRNFVGANKDLRDAWNEAKLQFSGEIAQTLATDGTQWHFIPAYSPSFGGLWETGVKSIKHHLKRVVTTQLTYEEMTTVLCQIEACLNSRPLCPIDDTDPSNTDPLTPGHFLIGEAPIIVPSPDKQDIKICSLSRWRHSQKMLNDFWRRWQDEYLSRLQQRSKWLKKEKEFEIGDVVLIKTDNLPPGKWSLGRILAKHPGSDGLTRVYSVKSGDTVTRRAISKLCELPVDSK